MFGIHKDSMPAEWLLALNTIALQSFTQIGYLFDPGIEVSEFRSLISPWAIASCPC